jgi:hypothetical protein
VGHEPGEAPDRLVAVLLGEFTDRGDHSRSTARIARDAPGKRTPRATALGCSRADLSTHFEDQRLIITGVGLLGDGEHPENLGHHRQTRERSRTASYSSRDVNRGGSPMSPPLNEKILTGTPVTDCARAASILDWLIAVDDGVSSAVASRGDSGAGFSPLCPGTGAQARLVRARRPHPLLIQANRLQPDTVSVPTTDTHRARDVHGHETSSGT